MAYSIFQGIRTGLALCLLLAHAAAQSSSDVPSRTAPEPLDMKLSPECRVPIAKLDPHAPLRRVASAHEDKKPIKVLALGPPMSGGSGWTSGRYVSRLEAKLKKVLPGSDLAVVQRSLPGDLTST